MKAAVRTRFGPPDVVALVPDRMSFDRDVESGPQVGTVVIQISS
jgi:hypothetical protein